MPLSLVVDGLGARRGEDIIFQNMSFTVQAGEALVVTGPNGSGKSTLLRVLAGLLLPFAGTMRLTGDEAHLPERSHYLGHRNAMKREMTVAENLLFWRDFMSPSSRSASIPEAIEALGLPDVAHLPFGYLSAGQQRRMAMARLLVAPRPFWLLDEPTAALDADADRLFAGLVSDHLASGGIAVAATHQPLGLEGLRELRMMEFAGGEEEPF